MFSQQVIRTHDGVLQPSGRRKRRSATNVETAGAHMKKDGALRTASFAIVVTNRITLRWYAEVDGVRTELSRSDENL